MADPFADPEFQDRTRKLLRVLATTQPGEAEAARRRLLSHLDGRGASWNDLVDRLTGGPAQPRPGERAALLDAEGRAQAAESRLRAAVAATKQALRRAEAAEAVRLRDRLVAGGAVLVSVAVAGWALLHGLGQGPPAPPPVAALPAQMPPQDSAARAPGATAPGPAAGQVAYVVSAGAAMRPASAGAVGEGGRRLLPGAPVVVLGRTWLDGAEWLRVRTELGEGFLPTGSVSFVPPSPQPGGGAAQR